MTKISFKPDEVWAYATLHPHELENDEIELAESTDYGVVITAFMISGKLNLFVYMDDSLAASVVVHSMEECEETLSKLYDEYMTSSIFNAVENAGKPHEDPPAITRGMQAEMDLREEELTNAALEFVMVALDEDYDGDEDIAVISEKAKEAFLGFLGTRLGLPVYRPQVIVCQDGTEYISDYPYQDLE